MSETGDEIILLERRYCPFSPTQLFWFSDRLLASELAANPSAVSLGASGSTGLTCREVMCLSLNLCSQ